MEDILNNGRQKWEVKRSTPMNRQANSLIMPLPPLLAVVMIHRAEEEEDKERNEESLRGLKRRMG